VFVLRYPVLATVEMVRETARSVQLTTTLSNPTNMIPSQIKNGSQYLKKREKFIAVVAGVSPAKVKRKECSGTGAATVPEIEA
jgi:hypothetical protein